MRKVKALKSFKGKEGFFYKGHIKQASKAYADALVKKGFVEEVEDEKVEDKDVEINVDIPNETKDITVDELKELAKVKGVKGYSNMKKAELVEALKE